jgi:hypothetical protein
MDPLLMYRNRLAVILNLSIGQEIEQDAKRIEGAAPVGEKDESVTSEPVKEGAEKAQKSVEVSEV